MTVWFQTDGSDRRWPVIKLCCSHCGFWWVIFRSTPCGCAESYKQDERFELMALRLQHFTCNHPTAHALSQPPTIPEPCHMRSALAAQPGFRRCSALVPSFMQSLRHFPHACQNRISSQRKIIKLQIKVCSSRWARGRAASVTGHNLHLIPLFKNNPELVWTCWLVLW